MLAYHISDDVPRYVPYHGDAPCRANAYRQSFFFFEFGMSSGSRMGNDRPGTPRLEDSEHSRMRLRNCIPPLPHPALQMRRCRRRGASAFRQLVLRDGTINADSVLFHARVLLQKLPTAGRCYSGVPSDGEGLQAFDRTQALKGDIIPVWRQKNRTFFSISPIAGDQPAQHAYSCPSIHLCRSGLRGGRRIARGGL